MNPLNLFWLFVSPTKGWSHLVHSKPSLPRLYMLHVIPFSLIPPLMVYFAGNMHASEFFPAMSATKMLLVGMAFFLVELVAVPIMGIVIRQLGEVAEIHPSYHDSFILAAVAPTPLWMAPLFLLLPSIPINLIVVTLAMMAAAGFIYYGVPIVFRIKERGHAILMFGGVLIAGVVGWGMLMVLTLVVWGSVQNLQIGSMLA